jgi:hypothetical protein
MSLKNQDKLIGEKRRYLRLDSVFPVQFRLETPDGENFLSDWLQGFTNNISREGICISINNLDRQLLKLLEEKKAKLSLEIDILISSKPIFAKASVVWVKGIVGDTRQYLVGVNYEHISKKQNSMLMRYVWLKKLIAPVSLALVVILTLILGINSWVNIKLTRGNKLLIEQLVLVLKDSNLAKQKVAEVVVQRENLQSKLKALEEQIATVESQKAGRQASDLNQIKQLNDLISGLREEKIVLEEKLTAALHKEDVVTQELLKLDQKKVILEKANLDKMYQWLKVHQNNHTGLVMSFEGDKDIANWGFTYDQALLVEAYTQFSDFARANKILNFFAKDAARDNGWFLNAYYINDGGPAEFVMNSGPNIWLGIAIMQYTQKTRDQSYLSLAENIAQAIMNLQNEDADGGIRGSPTVEWYSTEHNLDAYAFFDMLAKVTGNKVYLQAAQKTMDWLTRHTYDRQDLPVNRGKGDSTIATDTYAWSIAAIGPQKLQELGLDPDKIMEFVEENCSVEVNFIRPNAQSVKIKGFDFAPQRHTARGGVVSSEWTAQMVLAYKIMQDFYAKKGNLIKAGNYKQKAEMYLGQLGNMIISSSSPSGQGEGCLPYATQDNVDTGHGWMTPKGSHTGSISATAYTLFAYYGFNPLELKE